MFNLIVAVISIALIAAMAAASIFYGGTAFGSGTAQAQASTLINNGQQISGAQQLYMIDNSGNRADAIAVLKTNNYLQALPTAPGTVIEAGAAWEIDSTGQYAFIALDDDDTDQQNSAARTVCAELIAQGAADPNDHFADEAANEPGITGDTTSIDGTGIVADTGAGLLNTALGESQFACVTSGADLNTAGNNTYFVFKL